MEKHTGWVGFLCGVLLVPLGCTSDSHVADKDDSGSSEGDGSAPAEIDSGRVDAGGVDGGAAADAGADASKVDASGGTAGDGGSGSLHWFMSCGAPLCMGQGNYDSPDISNCTSETLGAPCDTENKRCDGVAGCGATYVCAATDPTMRPGGCPISRARFKEDIAYLDERALRAYHEQIMRMPLASYRYKHAEGAGPQLGFIIEDIEPSVAVSGDQVNLYGYLSMAVAAIKVQQKQIEALQRELRQRRGRAIVRPDAAPPRARVADAPP